MPPALIRVDLDRNRDIEFATDADRTTANRRFVFWVNNDRDIFDTKEEEQDDVDPAQGPPDFEHTQIACARDLEDFVRVHVRAPDGFDPGLGTSVVKLSITDIVDGKPAVNVCAAERSDLSYLSDANVAASQVARAVPTPVVDSIGVEIDPSQFVAAGSMKIAPLLLEGRSIGIGALTVQFFDSGALIAEDKVHLDLRTVNTLYDHWTVGDTVAEALRADDIPPQATPVGMRTLPVEDPDTYLLFVHGWRLRTWERRAFAETAFKRMWHLDYRGGFGLFSWPTEWHEPGAKLLLDIGNYDRSERKAWRSAPGLRHLLVQLNQRANRLTVMAHSMGNIVTSEALLLEVQENAPTPRRLMRLYLPSQAASVAGAYDAAVETVNTSKVPNVYSIYPPSGQPYFTGFGAAAGMVVNFFNRQDYALTNRFSWPFNQASKPDKGFGYKKGEFFGKSVNGQRVVYIFPTDRAVIFSHIAPAYSRALGAESAVAGIGGLDLQRPPFNFTADKRDHSAQFRSDITRRRSYWLELLGRL